MRPRLAAYGLNPRGTGPSPSAPAGISFYSWLYADAGEVREHGVKLSSNADELHSDLVIIFVFVNGSVGVVDRSLCFKQDGLRSEHRYLVVHEVA